MDDQGREVRTNAEKVLKALTVLSKNCRAKTDACIRYSTLSGQFYFHVPCEIKEGITLRGPGGYHRNTIEAAATAIMRELKGKHIVFNAYDDEKRCEIFVCPLDEEEGL